MKFLKFTVGFLPLCTLVSICASFHADSVGSKEGFQTNLAVSESDEDLQQGDLGLLLKKNQDSREKFSMKDQLQRASATKSRCAQCKKSLLQDLLSSQDYELVMSQLDAKVSNEQPLHIELKGDSPKFLKSSPGVTALSEFSLQPTYSCDSPASPIIPETHRFVLELLRGKKIVKLIDMLIPTHEMDSGERETSKPQRSPKKNFLRAPTQYGATSRELDSDDPDRWVIGDASTGRFSWTGGKGRDERSISKSSALDLIYSNEISARKTNSMAMKIMKK